MDKVDNSITNRRKPACSRKKTSVSPTHAQETLDLLETAYPEAHCALVHDNPWQLLVATILSAQCTDVRVNMVTPGLFKRYPGPADMAAADQVELEELIRSTGFFRNKAKSLIGCAASLMAEHDGQVPDNLRQLVALPGVGRKTANVVLGNAFEIPGMVVDTHVGRIARRLGWTCSNDAVRIEQDLCTLLPDERWTQAAHVLIFHGRQCCQAQTAWCSRCPVVDRCPQVGVGRQK